MKKPFRLAAVIVLCGAASVWAQSTGAVSGVASGDAAVRQQLKREMLEHRVLQQKAEAEFMKTLEGKPAAEKQAALSAHAKERREAEKAFRAQMQEKMSAQREKAHAGRVAYLKGKLERNPRLSAAEKREILDYMDAQYKSNADYQDKQFKENQKFMDKLSSGNLSMEERRRLMKEHAAASREAAKTHRQEQAQKNKAYREELRAKHRQAAGQQGAGGN